MKKSDKFCKFKKCGVLRQRKKVNLEHQQSLNCVKFPNDNDKNINTEIEGNNAEKP